MMSFADRRFRVYGTIFLCLLLSEQLSASNPSPDSDVIKKLSASQLLKSMSDASRTASYNGRFIYMANGKLRSLKVIHTNHDGQEFERLKPLSGGGPEILRKGNELICIHPSGDFTRIENSIPTGLFSNKFSNIDEGIDSIYQLVHKGKGHIAGRIATKYLMRPQDEYRYAHIIWLDDESGLLLKTTLLGGKGQDLETFEFVELNVGVDVPQNLFDYQSDSDVNKSLVVNLSGKMSTNLDSGWKAEWVPDGFNMAACDVRRLSAESAEVNALVYSDGMSSFTIYIEPFSPSKENEPMPQSHHGATAIYSRNVDDGSGKIMVTVVGELPMSAIKKIGASVVRKK
ncbi:MAG: MucB/RseB C-terminal domain-containing protein [Pseudomonadales bacterium]|nr:MucB/RseB C-terminal domain-containing protein [Pseudomonadales bacterium]